MKTSKALFMNIISWNKLIRRKNVECRGCTFNHDLLYLHIICISARFGTGAIKHRASIGWNLPSDGFEKWSKRE